MASACVNNGGVVTQEIFLDCPTASSMWRIPPAEEAISAQKPPVDREEDLDPDIGGSEFEFRLEDPVSSVLPADELFSDGKLVPLQLAATRQSREAVSVSAGSDVRSERSQKRGGGGGGDSRFIYRKTPRSGSRWKELLRLKKLSIATEDSTSCSQNSAARALIQPFLHRSTKSSMDSSLTLPLLQQQADHNDPLSTSSGVSVDVLPRLSVDSEKSIPTTTKPRVAKKKAVTTGVTAAANRGNRRVPPECTSVQGVGVSIDSPRMNPSGKIVFYGLERSSSSPSSFNGGPRYKHRGIERSYSHSASLRIAPFLNVPVRSLRGGNGTASSKSSTVFGIPIFSSSSHHKNPNQSSVKGSRSSS